MFNNFNRRHSPCNFKKCRCPHRIIKSTKTSTFYIYLGMFTRKVLGFWKGLKTARIFPQMAINCTVFKYTKNKSKFIS